MQKSTKVVIRTAIQWAAGMAVALPGIVEASGVSESLPWVAGGLAVAAAITRIMALPSVQAGLDHLGLSTEEQQASGKHAGA